MGLASKWILRFGVRAAYNQQANEYGVCVGNNYGQAMNHTALTFDSTCAIRLSVSIDGDGTHLQLRYMSDDGSMVMLGDDLLIAVSYRC